jgi:outer membrane receptor protein involved in Fe transport
MMNMRRVLLATTSVAVLAGLFAGPAAAQSTETVEKVTVTGTRIKQPNTQNNVSTQSINSQRIEMSGEPNVVDVLRDLPIVGVPAISSVNSNFLTSQNGVNTLDMRDLGTNRTLVLVNGRRFVAGIPLSQAVDFNSIPTELIERIDVLSGGSSAVYGSDAVAGVVNIILKRNFEGLSANFQAGGTETYPDADSYVARATMGGNFADDKGNAVLSVGYNHAGPAYARSREPIDCLSGLFVGGSAFGQICPVFSGFAEGGVFRLSDSVGSASLQRVIDHVDGTTIRPRIGADGFNRQSQRLHLVPSDRYQFTGLLNYDVAPGHKVFTEVSWTSTNSTSDFEPIPLASEDIFGGFTEQQGAVLGLPAGILPNNPYIPRDLLNLLGTQFGIVNPHLLARPVLVNQLMAIPGAVIGFQRRMSEIGNRGQDFEAQTARFVVGMEGQVGNWDYDVSVNYGRTTQNQVSQGGGVNAANMREALNVIDQNFDADNNPLTNPQDVICANPIAVGEGCVPVNLFIPVRTPGTWTPQQIAYLSAPVFRNLEQQQLIVSANATGTLFQNWAGDVDAAIGAEYRREDGADTTDALTRTGQNTGNIAPSTSGAFDVWEAFGEVDVPLLRGLPLVEEFNVHGAARFSEYSSFGYTMAWSADAEWIVTEGVRLRGQIGRAVRAPNIGELFTGASETFAIVTDPCNNLRTPMPLPGGPTDPNVIANCLAIPAIAARAALPGGFVLTQPELQGTGGFQQGNPNLQPEKSDSQQFGIIITPDFWGDFLGNLTLSADYFVVDISDAIAAVGRNTTLDLCFQTPGSIGPGGVNAGITPFCNQTPGGPVGWVRDLNGALIEVNTAAGNVNALETSGFELQAGYNFQVANLLGGSETDDYGRLSLTAVWQHINALDATTLAGTPLATLARGVGSVGVFDDEVNMTAVWAFGHLTLSWSGQWMSSVQGVDAPNDIAPESIPAQWFHDVSGTYDVTDNISIYGGVRNVANNYVFIGPGAFNATPTGWSTDPDTYDGLGRRYFFGVRLKM